MWYTIDRADEHVYQKEIEVEEGEEYQYKFRIGLGDWWVLNEDSPTGTCKLPPPTKACRACGTCRLQTAKSLPTHVENLNSEH